MNGIKIRKVINQFGAMDFWGEVNFIKVLQYHGLDTSWSAIGTPKIHRQPGIYGQVFQDCRTVTKPVQRPGQPGSASKMNRVKVVMNA